MEVVGGEVGEWLVAEDSGIIHQDIDSSEMLEGGLDDFAGGLLLSDIAVY